MSGLESRNVRRPLTTPSSTESLNRWVLYGDGSGLVTRPARFYLFCTADRSFSSLRPLFCLCSHVSTSLQNVYATLQVHPGRFRVSSCTNRDGPYPIPRPVYHPKYLLHRELYLVPCTYSYKSTWPSPCRKVCLPYHTYFDVVLHKPFDVHRTIRTFHPEVPPCVSTPSFVSQIRTWPDRRHSRNVNSESGRKILKCQTDLVFLNYWFLRCAFSTFLRVIGVISLYVYFC